MALRSRLAGATVALVVIAALAIFVLGAPSPGPLAQAADNLKGQRVKLQYQLSVIEAAKRTSVSASGVAKADGTAARLQVTYIVHGEDDVRGTLLKVGKDEWLKAPDLGSEGYVHLKPNAGMGVLSMDELSDFLEHAGSVNRHSTTKIRGVTTTYYEGMVDPTQLGRGDGFEKLFTDIDRPFPIQVWVDGRNRPLRVAFTITEPQDEVTVTTDILQYGVPVDVTAPSANGAIQES